MFLTHKNEDFNNFEMFCRKTQREAGYFITYVHRSHGGEFKNKDFEDYCAQNGYSQNISHLDLLKNGVIKWKNISLL